MDHEMRHFTRKGTPRALGLRPRRVEGNVDLAQEDGGGRVAERVGIGEWEGEDVGRRVHFSEIPIQRPDQGVVGEDDRRRGRGATEERQSLLRERPKSGRS
jgi:hypothetical protein